MNKPDYFKQFFNSEFQKEFLEFDKANKCSEDQYEEKVWKKYWNGGNLQDNKNSPFILVTASDSVDYCYRFGGYINEVALNEEYHELPYEEKLEFLESYSDYYLNW